MEGRVSGGPLMDHVLLPIRMHVRLLYPMCVEEKVEECLTIFLVEARLKVVGEWRVYKRVECVRNVLMVSELNKRVK